MARSYSRIASRLRNEAVMVNRTRKALGSPVSKAGAPNVACALSFALVVSWVIFCFAGSAIAADSSLQRSSQPRAAEELPAPRELDETGDGEISRWASTVVTALKEQGVSETDTEKAEALITDVLSYVASQNGGLPTGDAYRLFAACTANFVEMYQYWLRDSAHVNRTLTWLVFCIAEAADRLAGEHPEQPDEEAFKKATRDMVLRFTCELRYRLLQQLDNETRQRLGLQIENSIRFLEDAIISQIGEYRDDVLCPAFRKLPSEEVATDILRYCDMADLPRVDPDTDSDVSETAPDEMYMIQVRRRLSSAYKHCLFAWFTTELRPKLEMNEYLGHTLWHAQFMRAPSGRTEGLLYWPALVLLRQNDELNRITDWSRGAMEQ